MADEARTVADVIVGLERTASELPPTDGLKWFTLIYSESTKAIAAALERGDFEVREFMPRLVIHFANAYFANLHGTQMIGNAWLPLFDRRYDPDVAPLQFAIAGYNSQMGYEMPLGLLAAWRDAGATLAEGTPAKPDFDRLNEIVEDVHLRVREYLTTTAVDIVGHRFAGVEQVVGAWSHEDARGRAWAEALTLHELWDDPPRAAAHLARIDSEVGTETRRLLEPTGV